MAGTADKFAIALGAVTSKQILALVIVRGLGGQVPRVTLRPTSGPALDVIPERLTPGPTTRSYLVKLGISVYRVRAALSGEATLEASNASGTVICG